MFVRGTLDCLISKIITGLEGSCITKLIFFDSRLGIVTFCNIVMPPQPPESRQAGAARSRIRSHIESASPFEYVRDIVMTD